MVRVRLRNPGIIAMPISDEELKEYEDGTKSDEFLYVLYRLPGSGGIEIGMMSSSAINYYPGLANISRLDDATTKAYFYCGGSNLMNQAMEITDRPVYLIGPSDNRTVEEYYVINATENNGLYVPLEDVVDGKYTVKKQEIKAAEAPIPVKLSEEEYLQRKLDEMTSPSAEEMNPAIKAANPNDGIYRSR